MVPVFAMLLFGGSIEADALNKRLLVDGWAKFEAPGRVAVQIRELQAEVRKLLLRKIRDPRCDIGGHPALAVMQRLVGSDGV